MICLDLYVTAVHLFIFSFHVTPTENAYLKYGSAMVMRNVEMVRMKKIVNHAHAQLTSSDAALDVAFQSHGDVTVTGTVEMERTNQ